MRRYLIKPVLLTLVIGLSMSLIDSPSSFANPPDEDRLLECARNQMRNLGISELPDGVPTLLVDPDRSVTPESDTSQIPSLISLAATTLQQHYLGDVIQYMANILWVERKKLSSDMKNDRSDAEIDEEVSKSMESYPSYGPERMDEIRNVLRQGSVQRRDEARESKKERSYKLIDLVLEGLPDDVHQEARQFLEGMRDQTCAAVLELHDIASRSSRSYRVQFSLYKGQRELYENGNFYLKQAMRTAWIRRDLDIASTGVALDFISFYEGIGYSPEALRIDVARSVDYANFLEVVVPLYDIFSISCKGSGQPHTRLSFSVVETRCLQHVQSLKAIELHHVDLTKDQDAFVAFLERHPILNLCLQDCLVDDQFFIKIMLSGVAETLVSLHCNYFGSVSKISDAVCPALDAIISFPHLDYIVFESRENQFSEAAYHSFIKAVRAGKFPSLTHLSLGGRTYNPKALLPRIMNFFRQGLKIE